MNEEVFAASQAKLNYVEVPGPEDPPPLVMVHGVTRRWQTYLPMLTSLAVRRQVYALDWRGHGKSSRTPGAYRVVDYVTDLVEFVRNGIGRPAVLYGHSLGGMVVAAAAAELGDQAAGVLMEDPPLHAMGKRIDQTALLDLFKAMHRAAAADASIPEIVSLLADSTLTDPRTGQKLRLSDLRDQASLRFSASCLSQLDPTVLDSVVAGQWLDGYDVESIFERLTQPALLLQADPEAGGMLVDDEAELVTQVASDLTRVRLSGCSHNIHWDRTADVLNYVHTFMETL